MTVYTMTIRARHGVPENIQMYGLGESSETFVAKDSIIRIMTNIFEIIDTNSLHWFRNYLSYHRLPIIIIRLYHK